MSLRERTNMLAPLQTAARIPSRCVHTIESAQIPKFRRSNDPEKMAVAISHSNCESEKPNDLPIGICKTPSISQTAKSKVKAVVDKPKTIRRARSVEASFVEVTRISWFRSSTIRDPLFLFSLTCKMVSNNYCENDPCVDSRNTICLVK